MATLLKLSQMPIVQRSIWRHMNTVSRGISTSKKNSDAAAASVKVTPQADNTNWVSYGFDYKNQEEDTNVHNASFFFSISLCGVFGGFMWAYAPDCHLRDWAQREAFLELRRREKAGLKPIDPNFIDPKCITLPSDGELGDTPIVI